MSSIREVQLCGLEIMKVFAEICERHQLTYYMSCGTLLGAIRHDGFIPWDDDVDMEMPVEDYRQFLKYAARELPEEYFLQTYETDPGYNELWAKIRKNGTTSLPVEWKDYHIHFGIGIDIFPIAGIPDDEKSRQKQKKAYDLCRTLLAKDYILATGCEDIGKNPKLRLLYALPRGVRIALVRLLERTVFQSTKGARRLSIVAERLDFFQNGKDYQTAEQHVFEDSRFPIPGGYHQILTTLYGDYMTPPPVEERDHHQNLLGNIIFDCDQDYHEYQK